MMKLQTWVQYNCNSKGLALCYRTSTEKGQLEENLEHGMRHPEQQMASKVQQVAPSTNGKDNYRSSLGTIKARGSRVRDSAVRLCLLATTETIPIKSHQYDCPKMSWTRRTPTNMPNWTRKTPQGFNPIQKTTGNCIKPGVGEMALRAHQLAVHNQMDSPENYIIWTQLVYLGLYMYVQIHKCMQ